MTIPIPSMPAVAELKKTKPKFKSDGCTGFYDGYWRHCCVAHDYRYADGGPLEKRREADERLRDCVYRTVMLFPHRFEPMLRNLEAGCWYERWLGHFLRRKGYKWFAENLSRFMYRGVRIFGSDHFIPLYLWEHWVKRARWGFGRQ